MVFLKNKNKVAHLPVIEVEINSKKVLSGCWNRSY